MTMINLNARMQALLHEYKGRTDRIITEGTEDFDTMSELEEAIEDLKCDLGRYLLDLKAMKRETPNTRGIFSGPYLIAVVIEQDGASVTLTHEGSRRRRLDEQTPVALVKTGPGSEGLINLRVEELDYIQRWAVDALKIEKQKEGKQ